MSSMSTSTDTEPGGERRALALLPSQPWYATAPTPALDRQALEGEHTRVLARAVGDHLSYELVLRADELAAQLARIA
jgi:hypothetical protein